MKPRKLPKDTLGPLADSLALTLRVRRDDGTITPEHPMTGKQLADRWNRANAGLDLSDVDIRGMVNICRRKGNPIASTSKGYFWARTPKELQPTIDDMLGREYAIREARLGLQKAYGKEERAED